MTPWASVYYRVRQRCNDKRHDSYPNYGGRGIKCLLTKEEIKRIWFRDGADQMEWPSIDRVDVDGDYEFSNCRFVELSKNCGIRRNSFKLYCPNGHKYEGENLYQTKSKSGHVRRICRKCAQNSRIKYERKNMVARCERKRLNKEFCK